MAIHATDTRRMHSASEKRGEFIVFIPNLSIGIKKVSVIGDAQCVVIIKAVARNEFTSEFGPA
jgi:hypothetical protein